MGTLFLSLMNEEELKAISSQVIPIAPELTNRKRLEQLEKEKIELEDVIKKFLELQNEIDYLRDNIKGYICLERKLETVI